MRQNTGQLMKKRPRDDHNTIGNGALFYALENAILTVLNYSWIIHTVLSDTFISGMVVKKETLDIFTAYLLRKNILRVMQMHLGYGLGESNDKTHNDTPPRFILSEKLIN